MAGFSTWYHGTTRLAVLLIRLHGLTARFYGADPHGLGSPYHVLARERHQAAAWAHPGADTGAILTIRVPDDGQARYLTCPDSSCYCQGALSGLFKLLPASLVHSVEEV
ncbi:MAG TPA: hypothetical protein VHZ03_57095 [Trebonia sp.]|nr:hypothetical protein [Trebonia sp.]